MNIILVIFDSLRKDCIETYGEPPWGKVHTPNLAKFAEESFIMTKCYPESLPTLPVRRSIYTGKRVYPYRKELIHRGDFINAVVGWIGWGPIREDRTTISEMMQMYGYTTGLFTDIQHQFKPSKNFHRGFDEWNYIRGYELDTYRSGPLPDEETINKWMPPETIDSIISLLPEEYREDNKRVKDLVDYFKEYFSRCFMNMYGREKEEDYFVGQTMGKAMDWLKQNQDKEKLFLTIESWSPHEPWFVPEQYREMYTRGENLPQQVITFYNDVSKFPEKVLRSTRANYSGLVTMCDAWFGRLIDAVKDLGMLDDTLIIVTSDHGHSIGDRGYMGKRGYPSAPEVYDVPLFIRHPDKAFGRGIENNSMVQHTDMTATILDIAGIRPIDIDTMYSPMAKYLPGYVMKDLEEYPNANLHGKSFFNNIIDGSSSFRDHVTVAWGPAVTVIKDNWWLNCLVNGKGAILHNLDNSNAFDKNLASDEPGIVKDLFKLALKDANGKIPPHVLQLANDQKAIPGCSELALD